MPLSVLCEEKAPKEREREEGRERKEGGEEACGLCTPVCKVLSGHIANGQFGEHHLRSTLDNLLQLVVEDRPLCIDNFLVLLQHSNCGFH